jgi:hypothetical protein
MAGKRDQVNTSLYKSPAAIVDRDAKVIHHQWK